MKKLLAISALLLLTVGFTACNNAPKTAAAAEIQTVSMEIEGMTCEMGCKNAIEKKVAKMEGIQKIEIDFENAVAQVSYDANVTNPDEVIETIGSIGGGLYTAKIILAENKP